MRTYAPIRDQSKPQRAPEREHREVRAGDTLYSIAWESGLDARELAAWNDIEPPYVIRPGQRLRLKAPLAKQAMASGYHTVVRGETLYGIASATGVRMQDLAAWNRLLPPFRLMPGQRLRLTDPNTGRGPAPAARQRPAVARPAPREDAFDRMTAIAWTWPTEGTMLARFDAGASKGIDIGGASGQTIRAAAAGKVVYQGSGLRGYGKLIIIKHNADFLSAYAHCEATFVKEGDVVKSGQKIAVMGSTGTDRIKLHFEIRRRGIPVDPLQYLPKS
ncbi:MAG: peptidoglycan DD-metalloendopeptidase family protein [Gammaproteobacteria bacterium]